MDDALDIDLAALRSLIEKGELCPDCTTVTLEPDGMGWWKWTVESCCLEEAVEHVSLATAIADFKQRINAAR